MGDTKSLLSEIFIQEMKYDRALREGAVDSTTNDIRAQFRSAVSDLERVCESEGYPLDLTAEQGQVIAERLDRRVDRAPRTEKCLLSTSASYYRRGRRLQSTKRKAFHAEGSR